MLDRPSFRYWCYVVAVSLHLQAACGAPDKPIVAPNASGADCLAERQKQQLTCIQNYATRPEIEKCIADKLKSGEAPNCTNEAGVAAYITSRDSGRD